jgi:predicted nucleotidyltransferase
LPAGLQETLARGAVSAGLSFNEYCVRRLRGPALPDETSAVRALVLERAQSVVGARLQGIVVLGSWARGEAAADSDIDLLVVVDPFMPLTRNLYRTWDVQPVEFDGRPIDAHFVHLPTAAALPTGVWCETAVDGIVWYDRDGMVAQRLAAIRRSIAEGRLVRAVVHGQPYWKGAA